MQESDFFFIKEDLLEFLKALGWSSDELMNISARLATSGVDDIVSVDFIKKNFNLDFSILQSSFDPPALYPKIFFDQTICPVDIREDLERLQHLRVFNQARVGPYIEEYCPRIKFAQMFFTNYIREKSELLKELNSLMED